MKRNRYGLLWKCLLVIGVVLLFMSIYYWCIEYSIIVPILLISGFVMTTVSLLLALEVLKGSILTGGIILLLIGTVLLWVYVFASSPVIGDVGGFFIFLSLFISALGLIEENEEEKREEKKILYRTAG